MPMTGRVYSHTMIRVAGVAHAGDGPFALVLVDLDGGGRVLGRVQTSTPPDIDTSMVAAADADGVPVFEVAKE
ncbi:MAG: OB-fold domain-containing protein [Sciscionella sp.]